jgi:hypothetical protein
VLSNEPAVSWQVKQWQPQHAQEQTVVQLFTLPDLSGCLMSHPCPPFAASCPSRVHPPALRTRDSMHCRFDQPWSAATSGRNVAVRLHCRTGSVNSMMRPCVPICQSCQLSARSKLHKSETEQLRCATSFSCTGEKRESRRALQNRGRHVHAEGQTTEKQALAFQLDRSLGCWLYFINIGLWPSVPISVGNALLL